MRWFVLLGFAGMLLVSSSTASAQQSVLHSAPVITTLVDEFVKKQFGATCVALPGSTLHTGDLDGDGIEDAVIAARCSNPLPDQADHNFKVIDPYNGFYGYGDVRITSGFVTDTPQQRGLSVLIIHGAGPEAWRAATPKAKFLVINLPFQRVSVKRLALKKKTIMAIFAEESGEGTGTVSALYWDGKKYRYEPMGLSLE